MLNVAFRNSSAVSSELRILPVNAAMVLRLRATEAANPQTPRPCQYTLLGSRFSVVLATFPMFPSLSSDRSIASTRSVSVRSPAQQSEPN